MKEDFDDKIYNDKFVLALMNREYGKAYSILEDQDELITNIVQLKENAEKDLAEARIEMDNCNGSARSGAWRKLKDAQKFMKFIKKVEKRQSAKQEQTK